MRKTLTALIITAAAVGIIAAGYFAAPIPDAPERGFDQAAAYNNFKAKVVGVTDGDTITVLAGGEGKKNVKVRLWGIDAPEKGQPFSEAAKKHLSDLVYGRQVDIETKDVDRYGRLVALVSYPFGDGAKVKANTDMVAKGYAWWYKQYAPKAADLEAWEKKAREAKRGLWSEPGAVAPWEWRKRS